MEPNGIVHHSPCLLKLQVPLLSNFTRTCKHGLHLPRTRRGASGYGARWIPVLTTIAVLTAHAHLILHAATPILVASIGTLTLFSKTVCVAIALPTLVASTSTIPVAISTTTVLAHVRSICMIMSLILRHTMAQTALQLYR